MSYNNYKKSTLKAVINSDKELDVNALIPFDRFTKTGCSISQENDSSIRIKKPGLYLVSFNGIAVESETAGNLIVQLQNNGEDVIGAIAENTSESATSMRNLSFTTVIEVLNSCNCIDNSALLTVINEGVSAIFSNANLTIIKLC